MAGSLARGLAGTAGMGKPPEAVQIYAADFALIFPSNSFQ